MKAVLDRRAGQYEELEERYDDLLKRAAEWKAEVQDAALDVIASLELAGQSKGQALQALKEAFRKEDPNGLAGTFEYETAITHLIEVALRGGVDIDRRRGVETDA